MATWERWRRELAENLPPSQPPGKPREWIRGEEMGQGDKLEGEQSGDGASEFQGPGNSVTNPNSSNAIFLSYTFICITQLSP